MTREGVAVDLLGWPIDDEAGVELDGARIASIARNVFSLGPDELDPASLRWMIGPRSEARERHGAGGPLRR